MKKLLILGILIVLFVLYNCKNKETQPEEIVVPEKTKTEVLKQIDTTSKVSAFENEVEQSESIELTQTTTTEVTKPVPIKAESKTKTVTEPIVEKKTEVITEVETKTPVETKTETITETKTEVVINKPAETKTEPNVTETKKTVDTNAWKVPSKYITMKNPVPAKQDAAIGKSLYDKHCKSCHGKEGYGDGSKAADLKGNLGDFSSLKFQKQTDGELFYKTTFGRDDMPEYAKKLSEDEDRWLIVNYMRTLQE